MDPETKRISFILVMQTSFVLGVVHGISPCEHSWPLLTPFAIASRSLKRVMKITIFFCLGTTLACVFLGFVLGAIGAILPSHWDTYVGVFTSAILVILGLALIFYPHLLHLEHKKDCELTHSSRLNLRRGVYGGMFSVGFINTIVPCPTLAIIYSYAIVAKSIIHSLTIFVTYAITTSLVLLIIAYLLAKTSQKLRSLDQPWVETFLTRLTGVIIVLFGLYLMITQFETFSFIRVKWIL